MIVAVIPAKEGSTRLPNKNLLKINGKTLIEHAVESAKKSNKIKKIYVSTDSNDIAELVTKTGIEVIRRGKELSGEAPLIDVYRHAWKKIDNADITHIVGIQPDNPDRTTDIDAAVEYAIKTNIDNVFTVNREGKRNGALNILNLNALSAQPFVYSSSIRDDCTNIHSYFDYLMAAHNLSDYKERIPVAGRFIGKNEPVFIIAEAACNHMCQVDMAKKMIDLAADAGVDAIKFQTYKAEKLARREATTYWAGKTISQIEYYQRLDKFGQDEYRILFEYAGKKGIIGFSTPFDLDSASMLNEVGVPLFKIATCDLPDKRLLRHIAGFNKPILLSTGASTPEEIDGAVKTIFEKGNFQLVVLACTLSYPTKDEDAYLLRIKSLQERYPNLTIGLSDHTEPDENMIIPSVGVSLGAKVVEKHYTLDRSMTGSGHFYSVNPTDLKKMVANIRLTEKVMGKEGLAVLKAEQPARESARRSIVAERAIKKGEVISSDMLGLKRPADGLSGDKIDLILGKRARTDIKPDQMITLDMVENNS